MKTKTKKKTKAAKTVKVTLAPKTSRQTKRIRLRKEARRVQAEVNRRLNEMDFLASEIMPQLIDNGYSNPAEEAWRISAIYMTSREKAKKAIRDAVSPAPVLRLVSAVPATGKGG